MWVSAGNPGTGPGSGLPPYFAINAVLKRMDDSRLVFWDILPGGIAERVGIRLGDVLLGLMAKRSARLSRGFGSEANIV